MGIPNSRQQDRHISLDVLAGLPCRSFAFSFGVQGSGLSRVSHGGLQPSPTTSPCPEEIDFQAVWTEFLVKYNRVAGIPQMNGPNPELNTRRSAQRNWRSFPALKQRLGFMGKGLGFRI